MEKIRITLELPMDTVDMLNDIRTMTAEKYETDEDALIRIIREAYYEE